jgi:hypothetical protein
MKEEEVELLLVEEVVDLEEVIEEEVDLQEVPLEVEVVHQEEVEVVPKEDPKFSSPPTD